MLNKFHIDATLKEKYNITTEKDYESFDYSDEVLLENYIRIDNVKYSKKDEFSSENGIINIKGMLPSEFLIRYHLNNLIDSCVRDYNMSQEDSLVSVDAPFLNCTVVTKDVEELPNTTTFTIHFDDKEETYSIGFKNCGYGYFIFGNPDTLKLYIYSDSTYQDGFVFTLNSLEEYYRLGDFLCFVSNNCTQVLESIAKRKRIDLDLSEWINPQTNPCVPTPENDIFEQKQIETSAIDELNSLIGLESIKSDVHELISLVKMQRRRQENGIKAVPVSLHLVFTGNPGTGKTSVARILSTLYKEIGVLKKGQLIEVDRSDLVAGYVGQTALKTQEKINQAIGGILFIDEAYTLAKDGNDFGQEAIDTILKAMEDRRDEFIVIVAGYREKMENFINSNPGLRSRFNKYFDFPDYSFDELLSIFDLLCQKNDYILTSDAKEKIKSIIFKLVEEKDSSFANARTIRNLFEQIITRQSKRIDQIAFPNRDDMMTIKAEDL